MNENLIVKDENHRYWRNGEEYISVTTLLQEYFSRFDAQAVASRCTVNPSSVYYGQDVKDVIALWESERDYGIRLHEYIHKGIVARHKGERFLFDNEYITGEKVVCRKWNFPLSEIIVWSDRLKLAGTVDLVDVYSERALVYDIKTWKSVTPERLERAFLQIMLYAACISEMTNGKLQGIPAGIIHIDRSKQSLQFYSLRYKGSSLSLRRKERSQAIKLIRVYNLITSNRKFYLAKEEQYGLSYVL